MECMIRLFRAMGWCWCWGPRKRLEDGYDLEPFLLKRLPVFWVMGPPHCGKTTIATLLARCSDFHLIEISQMIKAEISKNKWRGKILHEFTSEGRSAPDEIVLNLLKEKFCVTYKEAIGYILDGFPLDMRQAKQFEFEICKVFIIIYPTLMLDALLVRMHSPSDSEKLRSVHNEKSKLCQEIYRYYEQKTLKCVTIYSVEILLNTLVVDLDRYFGYKFRFLSDFTIRSD